MRFQNVVRSIVSHKIFDLIHIMCNIVFVYFVCKIYIFYIHIIVNRKIMLVDVRERFSGIGCNNLVTYAHTRIPSVRRIL